MTMTTAFDRKPTVIWEITRACDLACRNCLNVEHSIASPEELWTYEAYKTMDEIASVHPRRFVISGGDPLQRKDIEQLLDYARANPGKLNYGNGGNGSSNHLGIELMASLAGISLTSIPYKGDAQAMADTMSGQVTLTLPTVVAATPHIRSGKLRALAVGTKTRVASLPEVPTMQEAGIPGYESFSWGGVMAPAGTPVVNKLHAELARILNLPDIQEKLAGLGATVSAAGPSEFAAFLQAEIRKWDGVARRANIRLE